MDIKKKNEMPFQADFLELQIEILDRIADKLKALTEYLKGKKYQVDIFIKRDGKLFYSLVLECKLTPMR